MSIRKSTVALFAVFMLFVFLDSDMILQQTIQLFVVAITGTLLLRRL
jgi:hypothetical protein